MIVTNGQGSRERRLSTCSSGGARRSRPSAWTRAWPRLCRPRSCTAQANAAMASSSTCSAIASGPTAMDPAKKSARFARGEATVISKVLGHRRASKMIPRAADACAARRNAASWLQARLCVMSSYMRDYAQRVRACADAVGKSLSLGAANNSLQRE